MTQEHCRVKEERRDSGSEKNRSTGYGIMGSWVDTIPKVQFWTIFFFLRSLAMSPYGLTEIAALLAV